MLSQIVRPMVRTQIRLLANSHATRSTLVNTIAQWLGFLGVRAQVTQIDAVSNQISVSLTVGKPEACDTHDWQQILQNLNQSKTEEEVVPSPQVQITPQQQSKLQRLLAYVIQVGSSEKPNWDKLYPQLQTLGFEESTLLGIRSALKVPQSLDQLMEGLDSDVAAIALPKAVSIALLDRQVNPSEDKALATLLEAMKQPASA
ncbi:hypothetical protein H6G00_08885 [Leptolyngbya sp. FACHB-541]|uniref:hypothetical protein n=1 Tax=Leptolyngbya sp. FACHB-541 TaxID=2692810 RepID=UPI001689FDCD|nr:hypothetical protein [Leptolyngbya sp. FACHB-541]MBD1870426.1 hypothetical protein [Cyanobacteria bacterium FACHB-471]MBD1996731.1 hypothetical protein [Leptolyngbya sp. FACHB-541]